jgi:hypothetical protein
MTRAGLQDRRPRRLSMIISGLLATLLLAGCVSVPTSGDVELADSGSRPGNSRPEVVPKPPVQNASPRVIIDGFLLAMSHYQPGYQIAKQFLTNAARARWRPEDKITIYNNPKYDSTESNVTLSMSRVGEVGADSSYTGTSGNLVQNFEMHRDKHGQWRISNPPDGLLISDTSFSANYSSYNLYFFDPQFRTLVPDPIYLPTDGQLETALMQALLRGPTSWLQSAVTTAFPPRLTVNSVPVVDNFAQISLGQSVQSLNDQQLSRMAAQIAWTLRQAGDSDVRGFRLTVNGDPLRVPPQVGSGQAAYVPIGYGQAFAPVTDPQNESLLAVHDNAVMTVRGDGSQLVPLAGSLGRPRYSIDSLAVSSNGRMIAAVTDGQRTLRGQVVGDQTVRTLLWGQTHMLRPDYTRYDELWAISGAPGRQQVRVLKDGKFSSVSAGWLKGNQVINFQVSPDGSRMAAIVKAGDHEALAIAPIIRGDSATSLGDLRTIDLVDNGAAPVKRLDDLGWTSATRLLILGAAADGASYEPYGVEIDGSQFERVGTSDNWGATSLATLVNSNGTFHAVVAGRSAKAWVYESGDQWSQLPTDLTHPAFPG